MGIEKGRYTLRRLNPGLRIETWATQFLIGSSVVLFALVGAGRGMNNAVG